MKKPIPSIVVLLVLLSVIISACSPAAGQSTPDAEVGSSGTATSAPEAAAASETPAATETPEPANLAISPETLGQLRFFWNAEFPGEINTSDNIVACTPELESCIQQSNITSYAFSLDGNTLAVSVCEGDLTFDKSDKNADYHGCAGASSIILYDSVTGEERGRLAPAAMPLSLAFHPDGTTLAAGLANSDIELWDLLSSEVSKTLSGSPKFVGVERLAFTPDGNQLLSGAVSSFKLSIWDWRSSEPPIVIERTWAFGISPDGRTLVTTSYGTNAGDEARIRIYDFAQIDQFEDIPLDITQIPIPPIYFSFNAHNGWISGTEAQFPAAANFWNPNALGLATSLAWDWGYEETGILYDLNSGGFTPDGYYVLNRAGELFAPEAQPDVTGLDEILWDCGFALADVEIDEIFYISHPMLYDECFGPENMFLPYLIKPLILSPDGRFIAGDDGFGSLRLWGIDPSLPAMEPACYGEC